MKMMSAHQILAVITMDKDKVGGQAPIFYATSEDELQRIALYLARILMGAVHNLDNGTLIVVKH